MRRAHGLFRLRLARGLALLVLVSCTPAAETTQPVAYPHKIHVAEEEIACTECHVGVEVADHATLPQREVCLACHEDPIGDSLEEARLVELLASGEPLGWTRVTRVAEHVHFSHRRHVVAGQILCETCHGNVHELVEPFTRPYVSFQGETGMERCIACHKASGNPRASLDCALCHR